MDAKLICKKQLSKAAFLLKPVDKPPRLVYIQFQRVTRRGATQLSTMPPGEF
jgi:hypothetical protein